MRPLVFIFQKFLLLTATAITSYAQQLQWESEDVKLTPVLTDTTTIAHFKFKNVGNAEVKITSVSSSCSCTKATVEKKSIEPGESGELTATFTIGVRTGLQEKIFLVESNDLAKPKAILKMKVVIPELARVRPTFLYWLPTEPLSAKEINVKILNQFPVKTITVESSNPKIVANVVPVKPGEEYRVIVTPSETDQPITASLTIKTDYPSEAPKTFIANVRVQPKK